MKARSPRRHPIPRRPSKQREAALSRVPVCSGCPPVPPNRAPEKTKNNVEFRRIKISRSRNAAAISKSLVTVELHTFYDNKNDTCIVFRARFDLAFDRL